MFKMILLLSEDWFPLKVYFPFLMVNELDLSEYIVLKDASNGPQTYTIANKRKEVPIHNGTEEEIGKIIKLLTCRMQVDAVPLLIS